MSKTKKGKESEIQKYKTLDQFLTPIIEKFSFKPDKDFARYLFGLFNNLEIYYYAINGEMCFTLQEFSKYIKTNQSTVKKAFQRNNLLKNKHYFEINLFNASSQEILRDNLSPNKRGRKASIFLTFLGVWKLLPTFRGDIPQQLYDWFGEKLYLLMKINQLSSGEFFFMNKVRELVTQVIGDKSKCFVDEEGFMYSSKGEMLIAKTLRQLNVYFQYNAPINLPFWLVNKLQKEYPKEILLEAGWIKIPIYITSDFLLRIIPRTVVEYWGITNQDAYNAKREIKEYIYRELEIRCVPIEANEDHNLPMLKQTLIKKLDLEAL